jgi:hypothetical protein
MATLPLTLYSCREATITLWSEATTQWKKVVKTPLK